MRINQIKKHLLYSFIATITLGLAPMGDPHIFGKIKWVKGGAVGMKPMDWFDLFLHGTPWLYFCVIICLLLYYWLNLLKNNKLKN
ncbi:MAG: hypothetical protein HYU67_04180 [Flavobacteriia bacterium]|nr:hypothetical protein [Flavobacteriia bacterium]